MSSIKPKIGTCTVCNKADKPLMKKMCCDGYMSCYEKQRWARYNEKRKAAPAKEYKPIARISEKQSAKNAQLKPRVKAEDKSQPELLELAQIVFNKHIRKRDSFDGMFCCITEDKYFPVDQMDAGHFFPISTSSALRFEEDNCHGENRQSNCFDPHHLKKYKPNLINKIGQKRFDELEAKSHEIKHWSKAELLEIIQKYKGLSKSRLENNAA